MGVGSVECGLLKLVEDNEALVVVGVVGHGHGNCGRWEAPEIRVAYEGRDPFSLRGNTEALCERNPRRAEDFLHGPDGGVALPNGSALSCGRNARGRKALHRRKKRLASEATQFLPTCERPPASSAC